MCLNRIAWLFEGEKKLALLALILLGVTVFFLLIGYFCNSVEVFFASSSLSLGGACFVAELYECTTKGVRTFFFLFVVAEGVLYFFLYLALRIKGKVKERKRKRRESERKIEYVLPEKDNSYVRDRLHTALQFDGREEKSFYSRTQMGLRLGYAKELAERLKAGTLSMIERAEVDEMLKILSDCSVKDDWSGKEVHTVNQIFMRLLKLSAKYEIAI